MPPAASYHERLCAGHKQIVGEGSLRKDVLGGDKRGPQLVHTAHALQSIPQAWQNMKQNHAKSTLPGVDLFLI